MNYSSALVELESIRNLLLSARQPHAPIHRVVLYLKSAKERAVHALKYMRK